MTKVGEKVGAVSHEKDGILYLYGYGTYVGDRVPTEENKPAGWIGESVFEGQRENPCIELDTGKVVWGCECWWGSLSQVEKWENQYEVVIIDIEEKRKEYYAK